jgi:hypothetical protein
MALLTREKADAFWWGVTESLEAGERILLVAEDQGSGAIVGTVQVVLGQPENQPHRRPRRRRGDASRARSSLRPPGNEKDDADGADDEDDGAGP